MSHEATALRVIGLYVLRARIVKEGIMPFEHPMRPYTREDIQSLKPDQTGVYGIFQGDTSIYVGSGDIRDRMMAHFNGDNPCITRSNPTQWTASILTDDLTGLEGELIQEYRPTCNQRVPQ